MIGEWCGFMFKDPKVAVSNPVTVIIFLFFIFWCLRQISCGGALGQSGIWGS